MVRELKTTPTKKKPAAPAKRRPGRPSFVPTARMRNDVAVWKAGGMSDESIAMALSIDAETMKKHFREELDRHWTKKLAKVVSARYKSALKGNVSAQAKFIETARSVLVDTMMGQAAGAEGASAGEKLPHPGPARKNRIVPIGKKEAAEEAAKTAGLGTEWGDDLVAGTPVQ